MDGEPTSVNVQGELLEDSTDQDLSEDANYRETIRGVRSFMGLHEIPDYDSTASSLDDNPFAGSRAKPTGKVSVKLPVDEWLCKKFEKLNVTVAEGYPSRNTETGGLLRDQFVKTPRSSKWYAMHVDKKDSASTTVSDWSPEPAKLNSMFSRVARRSLPSAPASRTFSQDTLRQWERAFQEQSVMCNQAAGLSRCLTKVQDSMVTQLKSLRVDKTKGKTAERTQQAVELEYLVTFNWSISQAMQHMMQDLSEGVFISLANLTLARRDSYLEFIRGGVKPDTFAALHTAPVHLHSLFPDSLLVKAEDEISCSEERHSSGSAHRKPGRFHPYASSSSRSMHQPDWKPTTPAWKQIRDRQMGQKGHGKASPKSRPRVQRKVNDNYCVLNVVGVKDSVHESGKNQDLNPSPVTSKSETVFLHVNSCVANVHSVTGLPQKKGINPNYCYHYTEIKHVNDVSCVGHLSSANTVTNVPTVAINPPVGARLQQFWEKWEALGSSPKVVTIQREGYSLPFRFQSNQVTNGHKQLCQPTKTVPPSGGTVSPDKQKCSGAGSKPKLAGFLQPAIFGTQTQQPVETYPGPEHLEHLPKHRVVQNGDPRDNKDLPTARGVGHLHRLQGLILPYTNSHPVQEVHEFSHPGSVLPVQSSTLWPVLSTHGVDSGGQRGQTDGFTEGYKNPPVPRRLVGDSHIPPNLSPTYTDLGSSLSRTRFAGEQGEVRTGAKTGFQLRRLPVRPQGGQGQTYTRALADLNKILSILSVPVCPVRKIKSI